MKLVHLFPNGRVERGSVTYPRNQRNGRPGYRWVEAYSEVSEHGVSIPLPRREWFAMANRDGFRVKFHDSEADAKAALNRYGLV